MNHSRAVVFLAVVVICIAPTIPGVAGIILTSASYVPALDMNEVSFSGFQSLFEWPGLSSSITTTLFSAVISTLLATLLSFAFLIRYWLKPNWNKYASSLSPLLAMPHVAFAIGFIYLFSPTGWIARAFEPFHSVSSYFQWLVNDPYGIGLIIVLTLKEIPFLLLMSIAILKHLKVDSFYKTATSLRYSNNQMWWKLIFPLWLPKIRFPIIAVLIYAASVVDLSMVIGPTNPPTFSVLVWQWFLEPNLQLLPRAAAGAVLLAMICAALISLYMFCEFLMIRIFKRWQYSGRASFPIPQRVPFYLLISSCIAIIPLLAVWTFAKRWRFPDISPSTFSLRFWENEWSSLLNTFSSSFFLAIASATIALILAISLHEISVNRKYKIPMGIIVIPMIVPQISLLFGIQVVTLAVDSSSYLLWVIWSHVFFAFPYIYLSLDGPWRSYEQRYTQTALSMGKSMLHIRLNIKGPMLFSAIIFAWAIGASVSLAQYLPTLMLGGGRISTVTTEAVALMSGSDRRVSAIYGLSQALLPLFFYMVAIIFSRNYTRKKHLQESTRNESQHSSAYNN